MGKFKDTIAKILKENNSMPSNKPAVKSSSDDSSAKLFEEIKVMFKDLPTRIEGNYDPEYISRKKRKFHPMMLDEMMHLSKNGKVGIIMGLGMLRDIIPWVYDIGMDTLRIVDSSATATAKHIAIREFDELLEMSTRHPIMREMLNSKEDFMLLEELPHMLGRKMEKYFEMKVNNT